jgi:uncharacterized protein (DUF1810 family)
MEELDRFIHAQDDFGGYEEALREMKSGMKTGHWIWYIFPQIRGLGHSYNANYYSIKTLDEARAYLAHPVLGARLKEITTTILAHKGEDIYSIMGSRIDVMKLRSSMTLFDLIAPKDIYDDVLAKFFEGKRDQRTIDITNEEGKSQNTL